MSNKEKLYAKYNEWVEENETEIKFEEYCLNRYLAEKAFDETKRTHMGSRSTYRVTFTVPRWIDRIINWWFWDAIK